MAIVCDDKWQKGQREKRHLFKSKPHFCYRNQHSCQLNEGSESVAVVDLCVLQPRQQQTDGGGEHECVCEFI